MQSDEDYDVMLRRFVASCNRSEKQIERLKQQLADTEKEATRLNRGWGEATDEIGRLKAELLKVKSDLEDISEADSEHKELRYKLTAAMETQAAHIARYIKLGEENKRLEAELIYLAKADSEPDAGEARGMNITLNIYHPGGRSLAVFHNGILVDVKPS